MAGAMAAKLFTAQTWVSTVSTLLLLVLVKHHEKNTPNHPKPGSVVVFIAAGLILALLSEFLVSPRIVLRENLSFWHTTGSVMYLLQWFCASLSLGKLVFFGPEVIRAR